MTDRDRIIEALRATTRSNGGEPLSTRAFFEKTKLNTRDLHRAGWPTHGALLESEGYAPRWMRKPYSDQQLFEPLANLTRTTGRFPTQNEREVERHRNGEFPSSEAYRRRAQGESLQGAFLKWCQDNAVYQDLQDLLLTDGAPSVRSGSTKSPAVKGYVYMIRSGRRYKIGRETTAGARQAAAGTWLENPDVVHRIATADPAGIERYWHERFKQQGKHVKGELFDLTASDVVEFKRWKKIV